MIITINENSVEMLILMKWLQEVMIQTEVSRHPLPSGICFGAPAVALEMLKLSRGKTEVDERWTNPWMKIKIEETWVSFLNVSLKYHADVIAGRQVGLFENWNNNDFQEWNYKSTI